MLTRYISFSNLTLLVALALSTVAAYYSIIGLTAIFAGAVIPIIIMGSILEVGKITTTVWLRKYWHRASLTLKFYLVPAVVLLAFLTSMGIFGFLSKAHTDQNLVSGDVVAKVSLLDEKIKTQRENIELARKALAQLDAQVDQRLARGESEQGAERAIQIRRQQQGERAKLQKEISDAQKEISKLNEERAPIAAEVRKVEAEVGPIKYIAAFIYGDNPDANLLEAAVRWVIILIVIVFDPLAIALVLAANASKEWDKEETEESYKPDAWVADVGEKPTIEELKPEPEPIPDIDEGNRLIAEIEKEAPNQDEFIIQKVAEPVQVVEPVPEEPKPKENHHPVGWMFATVQPLKKKIRKPRKKKETPVEAVPEEPKEVVADSPERPGDYVEPSEQVPTSILVDEAGYVEVEGMHMHSRVLGTVNPKLGLELDESRKQIKTGFGIQFPMFAETSDMFVRVDVYPNKVFKFNGKRWIEVSHSESHLGNKEYLEFLVNKISKGEYDAEMLSEAEQDALTQYIGNQKN